MRVPSLPRNIICSVTPFGITARYWRLRPLWARIGAASYYEIGRVWIGPAIVDTKGAETTWGHTFVDPGTLDESGGGQEYEDPRTRRRVVSLGFACTCEQAYGFAQTANTALDVPSFQGLQIDNGRTGDLIAIPKDDNALWVRRTGIYGHLTSEFDIQHIAGENYSVQLSVTEER